MAGLVPAILPFVAAKAWMPATGAGMTWELAASRSEKR
jgi:hypothetical protein